MVGLFIAKNKRHSEFGMHEQTHLVELWTIPYTAKMFLVDIKKGVDYHQHCTACCTGAAGTKEWNEKLRQIASKLSETRPRLYRRRFCKWILVGKLSARSTQCTPLHRSSISKFQPKIVIIFSRLKNWISDVFSFSASNFAIFFSEFFMKFCPDFATNSRKEWRV